MIGRALVGKLRSDGMNVITAGRAKSGSNVDYHWQLGSCLGMALGAVDSVVHLAARVHVRGKGFSDEEGFLHDNAKSTLMLAEDACALGVKRFVFISSIGVLGSSSKTPLTESAPLCPHNAYTSSKSMAEQLLMRFAGSSGMELVILRPPAVIGAGAKGNVRSLVSAVKTGIPLPFALLRNQRQFVTLPDLLEAISLSLSHSDAPGEVFHVASPERFSTKNMCEMIADCLGVAPRQWPVPVSWLRAFFVGLGRRSLVEGLSEDLLIATDKITTVLGWQPRQLVSSALCEAVDSLVASSRRD